MMKDFRFIKTGNAFDFETQAVVDRTELVKKAEESLRKAEAERNRHRGEQFWEEAYVTAKKDLERAKQNLERAKRQKTGNSYSRGQKIGKEGNSEYVINDVLPDGTIMVSRHPDGRTFTFSSEQELKDWLRNSHIGNESIDKQEWSMFKGLKKEAEKEVGNADIVSEYNAEIQRLTKKAEQLRRMGQGRSAMEIEKQIEKLGKELRELGNKKVGNYFNNGVHLTIRYNGKEEEVKVLKDMPTSVVVKGQNGAVVEIKKVDLDVLKVHNEETWNETKAEEKFGKVMGEYEEGALKTPQGKTVTDPAQAKAIAYSEADKVDNLKRARNAMNNKK